MNITEPTTMLTDYLIGLITIYFSYKLFKSWKKTKAKPVLYWAVMFTATSVGAWTAGTYHGFQSELSYFVKESILWKSTMISIGIASLSMLIALGTVVLKPRWARVLTYIAVIKFCIYFAVSFIRTDFYIVIADYIPSMLLGLVLVLHARLNLKKESSNPILFGFVISFLGAGIQMSGFKIHEHFNHNDLYHVIQMFALYFMYRGGPFLANSHKLNN